MLQEECEVAGSALRRRTGQWVISTVSTLLHRFRVAPGRPVESPSVLWLSDNWRTPGVCVLMLAALSLPGKIQQ